MQGEERGKRRQAEERGERRQADHGAHGSRQQLMRQLRVIRALHVNVLNGDDSVPGHEVAGIGIVQDPLGAFIPKCVGAGMRMRAQVCQYTTGKQRKRGGETASRGQPRCTWHFPSDQHPLWAVLLA